MWITARSLYHQLSRVLTELDNEPLSEELVKNLRDNIQYIKSPLTNKPKNASQRALCEPGKAVILSNGQRFEYDRVITDEAKILSDLFDINEVDAVELILTGELQTRNFNTLPRGLCAVLCYYQAHRHFILVLKMLLRLKTVADDMMPTILIEFVDSLLKDKELFKRILSILQNFNVKSEFEKLQQPKFNGLGTVEHQRALSECIEDIGKSCYEILCIFCHNSPVELHAEILESLFTAMQAVPLEQDSLRLSVANLAIWTSILVFINPTKIKHSQNVQQIFEIFHKNLYQKWKNPTACASIAFCFGIAVKCARNYPGGFRNQMVVEESKLLDTALDNCALQFIRTCILDVPNYSSFEVTVDIVDSFIKSFLCYFQEKNQELFNICEDELLRINDVDEDYMKKPNLYYLKFLDMVTQAYAGDSPKMSALCEQFTLSKYTPLVNFLTTARNIGAPKLFIPYIEMITTFCKTERVAQFVFQFFTGDERSMATWDRLFNGLSQYLNDFNGKQRNFNWQTKAASTPQKITSTELAGILTFLRLAKIVAEKSDDARLGFYESHRWNIVDITTGMLIEPFPASLKGELYEFLASLAIDERASMRIWSSLIQKKICTFDNKVLHGIQEEFQKEKANGFYNCTMGFLKLVSRLLSRKNVPTSKELTPFLQFITGSIMGTFGDGKFSNTDQLYVMLTLCIDSLYQLLRHFYITTESVANNKTQVYILGEILNDTDLSRIILLLLTECSNRIEDYSPNNELRDKLSLSCLRLLTVAIGHRQSFIVAIRKTGVSKLVATLEKLFLSPLSIKANTTYLNILMSFVSTSENLIKHTFFVVKILRELVSQRPSLQAQLVSVLFSQKELYQSIFTRLTSVYDDEMSISPNDIPLFDLPDITEATKIPRLRGEIARLIIEIFVDSLEADPTKPNLTYLFCGFDLNNIGTSILTTMDTVGESTSCLQSFINITEIFIAHIDPFNASFAALFEPTLRLFLRMLSFKTESSTVMLQYLRVHYDLIYRLTTSPAFQKIDYIDNIQDGNETTQQQFTTTFIDINQPSCTDPIFRRAVQGIILQLAAIELTSLLAMGQTSEPQKFYASLFSPAIQHVVVEDGDESSIIPAPMKELPLIWALLENSKADCEQLPLPTLKKFHDRRIDEILGICLRDNGIGVEQYDVLYLQFLLITEIDSIISAEIREIEMECQSILRYCTRYNARRLVEASCVHLLSGWVAVMNTLAFFAPVNFIEVETQRLYLVDALFLILKYTGDIKVNDEVAGGISNTVYRLVTSIADLVALDSSIENRRILLGDILTHLFHYLISSEYAKCVSFKLDLYGSIMKIFTLCCIKNDEKEEQNFTNGDLSFGALESILKERKEYHSSWGSIFAELSENVIRAISEDINFAPFQLKRIFTSKINATYSNSG
uniref:Uncharacterized protein n=1 Tax=Panagrolaimus sp. ES5 TaxID=591445 RepID=A0AC34GXQ6_9BILA